MANPTLQGIQLALSGSTQTGMVLGQTPTELQTLQLALQQQQQNLHQQLQNFLLLQPGAAQASAMFLHSQVQQAVTQATNQLKSLQRQREMERNKEQLLQDTPKSNPRPSPPFQESVLSKINKTSTLNKKSSPISGQVSPSRDSSASPTLKQALKYMTFPSRTKTETPSSTIGPVVGSVNSPRLPMVADPNLLVPKLDLPADENVDLEELEQFAKEFKQRRIKLGPLDAHCSFCSSICTNEI